MWVIFFALFACQKELELDVPEEEQYLVVDGWMEQNKYAKVFLTKTSPYFGKLDSAEMVDLVARFAKVSISNGQQTEILTLKRDFDLFPPYYYQSTQMKGEVGKSYFLKIELSGQVYTASTSIPSPVAIDTVYFKEEKGQKGKGFLYIRYQDPPGANYYRLYTMRKGKDKEYRPVYFPTYRDASFDGKMMTSQLILGAESNTNVSDDLYFEKGDTVMIRLTTIDQDHYDFWKYADSRMYTSSNPFAITTNEVITNVQNGLGVWGGYGASYVMYVIR